MTFSSPFGIERQFGGPNGYGHRGFQPVALGVWSRTPSPPRTPFGHLARRLGMKRATDGAPHRLVDFVLDAKGPGIFDQGATSSCTGNAKAGSMMTRLVAMGRPAPYRLSPACLYKIGRRIDIPPRLDGTLEPLVDDGAIPEQVTRALAEWGVCSYDVDPTDPATINKDPDLLELEQSLALVTRGVYGIAGSSADRTEQVKLAIDSLFPVDLGTLVDPAFENYAGVGIVRPPDPARILGGHALYVVDYDETSTGTFFRIVNSWSPTWGDGGLAWVDEAWLAQAESLEVVDINHNGAS